MERLKRLSCWFNAGIASKYYSFNVIMDTSKKLVADQKEWSVVAKELEGENLKLASYDNTLMTAIGDITGKKVLDYGADPGVLALGDCCPIQLLKNNHRI